MIRELNSFSEKLTSAHRRTLGRAYVERGRLEQEEGNRAGAAKSYLTARLYVGLPTEALLSLARWLATNPQVLILDEPTRGIDVGAKAEIQKLVLSLAEEGKACVFISSELEEVIRTSHRIVVLRDREKVTEFTDEVDERDLMQ